jgi:hypothetical protein
MRKTIKREQKACDVTVRWLDNSEAIRNYKGDQSDSGFQDLLKKESELYIEFLELHPYCVESHKKYLKSLLPKLKKESEHFYKRAMRLMNPDILETSDY